MSAEITPTNMDDHYRALIDGTGPDPWGNVAPVSSRKAAREYRTTVQASFHAQPIRHRRQSRLEGFIRNPMVIGAEVAIILACAVAVGIMAARFLGAS